MVMPCCYTPPVFELFKHVFNFITLFVERLIVFMLHLAVSARGDAGCDAVVDQLLAKSVGIITPIRQQMLALWKTLNNHVRPFVID